MTITLKLLALCPYAPSTQGYIAPQLDVTVNTVSYKHNNVDDTMEVETVNSKGKVKIKKLSNGFAVTNRIESCNNIGEIVFATITYSTKTFSGITIIPGNDYTDGKYDKYFKPIIRLPGCSKAEFNALIGFAINTASCQKQILFPHQGICEFENGVISFAGNPGFTDNVKKFISTSVLKRKSIMPFGSEKDIIENWPRVYDHNPKLKFISRLRIISLLMYFLNLCGLYVKQFVIVEPSNKSDGLDEAKLSAMLSTNDIHKYPIPTLESGNRIIEKEHSEVWDGINLIADHSFADEEDKIIDRLKSVIRCVRKSNQNVDTSRNITVVISKNAAYHAVKLAPDNVLVIDAEDIMVEANASEIESITYEMDALVYAKVGKYIEPVKMFFAEQLPLLRNSLSNCVSGEGLNTLIALLSIENFLKEFLGISGLDEKILSYYIDIINNSCGDVVKAPILIINEFAGKLSGELRSKEIRAIRKSRNMQFYNDGKTGVISGNRLLVSSAMLGSVTDDVESAIMTFRTDGDLICTDGHTHPFDSHDSTGKYQRLYFYDLPADILDEDVLYMLQNPETAAFLLTKEESNIEGFMPLISDKSGKTAGKRFAYNDAENDSVIIYGQSGEGKTHTVCQIMAHRYSLGHDIVIFDSSDSFTYEAMCHNLPRKFVDKNITFYNLYHGELHINPIDIERSTSLSSQKKELSGLLTAGVGNLSEAQKSTLRSALSKLLSTPDKNTSIKADELIAMLDEKGGAYEALRNRLNPFLEDIRECSLVNGSWNDYFNNCHKIHVIHMDAGFSENGNQIIDVLLASLFNYKRENTQRPLSVIIDEVQNQNFSASSPIRKILKEGRKHHLSVVAATQDFYARSTEIGSALGKAGMQIFHRPTQDSANLVAAELRFKKADMERFDSMERGDVIIKGALYNKEQGRNMQTIMSGHIVDYLMTDEDDKSR